MILEHALKTEADFALRKATTFSRIRAQASSTMKTVSTSQAAEKGVSAQLAAPRRARSVRIALAAVCFVSMMPAQARIAGPGGSDGYQGLPQNVDAALRASWFNLRDEQQPNVQLTALRRTYELPERHGKVTAYITAGTLYRLYVNGELAATGPAPATKGFRFVDEVDVTELVKAGANTVAIEWLYLPYAGMISIFPEHEPGLAFCLTAGEDVLQPAGAPWRYRWFRAWRQDAPHLGESRAELLEDLDLRKIESGWKQPGFADEGWDVAAAGAQPSSGFLLRPVPLPSLDVVPAAKRVETGLVKLPAGEAGSGAPDAREILKTGQFRPGGAGLAGAHGADAARLPASAAGLPYALLDLGGPVAGKLELDFTLPEGARLDAYFIEELHRFNGEPYRTDIMMEPSRFSASLTGDGQRRQFASFHRYAGRYVLLVASGLKGDQAAVVHTAGVRDTSALPSAPDSAAFLCSDPELNEVYEGSLRAMRLCVAEFPMDGVPDEEKMYVEYCAAPGYPALHIFHGRQPGFVSTVLDMLLDTRGSRQGWPAMTEGAVRQTSFPYFNLDVFFSLVRAVHDIQRYYGGKIPAHYLAAFGPMVAELDRYTNDEGLLDSLPNTTLPLDISRTVLGSIKEGGATLQGVHVGANALYYKTLNLLHEMTGDSSYSQRAEKLEKGLLDLSLPYISKTGSSRINRLVPDAFLHTAEGLKPFEVPETWMFGVSPVWLSEVTQYRLLNSGVLPAEDAARLWDVLAYWQPYAIPALDDAQIFNVSRMGTYPAAYERYQYLMKMKRADLLLPELKKVYARTGALSQWSAGDRREAAGGGINNSMYASLIFEAVTGIRPGNKGGYRQCLIEPLIDDSLTWARGLKETPEGTIGVKWSRSENEFVLDVSLPPGVTADVVLPPRALAFALEGGHPVPPGGLYRAKGTTSYRVTRDQGVAVESGRN